MVNVTNFQSSVMGTNWRGAVSCKVCMLEGRGPFTISAGEQWWSCCILELDGVEIPSWIICRHCAARRGLVW